MKFKLFQSQSFAPEKLNDDGAYDPRGISDLELGDRIARWIGELSGDRIEVVRTHDPLGHYVSQAVRRDICSSDAALCIFTKRTKDHLKENKWIPSTYVISEASAALMQFPSEEETHRRLFGLVERGVDVEQLGMAFPRNKVAPEFRRSEETHLRSLVKDIVEKILDTKNPVPVRKDWQYLAIDKIATIKLDGSVLIETRHQFRFLKDLDTVRIPHTMWRISRGLPPIEMLLATKHQPEFGYLRARLISRGGRDPGFQKCTIHPKHARWDYERNFAIELPGIRMQSGEELEYEIAWCYPDAFHNPHPSLPDSRPNCVGLRTSGRGTVSSASLTLQFERDLDGEPERILEGCPQVYTTQENNLPGAQTPEEFLHDASKWNPEGELKPCSELSCNRFDVYRWSAGPFQGMAKIIWTPHPNYFQPPEELQTVGS